MIKRVISVVTLALLLCQSVNAASIKTAEYSNGNFSLSGKTDEFNKPVKIEVLNNAVSYEDTKNVTLENVRDVYLYIDQSYSDSEGNFSFNVPTDGKIGNFSVKVSFLSGEEIKTDFYTYTNSQLETAVKIFLNDTEKTTDKLDSLIDNYYLGLGIDMRDIKLLDEDSYNTLLNSVIAKSETDELKATINEELILNLASQGTDAKTLEKYSSYIELSKSNYYEDWKLLSDDDKQAVCDLLKGVSTIEELNEKAENQIIIKTLADTIWSDMENKLSHYEDNISVDLDEVKDLSDSNQKKVYVALKDVLSDGEITSLSEIKTKLGDLVEKYEDDSSSGGGGSGSSKGGATSSYTAPVTVKTPEQSTAQAPFNDIKNVDWASTAIIKLFEKGIVAGKGDNTFDPNGNVTREEFTAMIVRSFGIASNGTLSGFEDVPNDRWSSQAIAAAKQNGIVSGMSDTYFGATDKILRRDIAVIAYNAAVKYSAEFSGENLNSFSDADKISEYAKEAVSKLSAAKIVNGSDGSFKPDDFATRAEAAVIIYRIMQYCAIMD